MDRVVVGCFVGLLLGVTGCAVGVTEASGGGVANGDGGSSANGNSGSQSYGQDDDAAAPAPAADAGKRGDSGSPSGTVDSGSPPTSTCADPSTPAGCTCASGHTCTANNCYGGYLCDTSTNRCKAPTSCP